MSLDRKEKAGNREIENSITRKTMEKMKRLEMGRKMCQIRFEREVNKYKGKKKVSTKCKKETKRREEFERENVSDESY